MKATYVYAGCETFHEAVATRLAQAGFDRVGNAADAQFIVTFCTSQTQLEDAYFDEEGFVQSAVPGTLFVDLSASTPSFARELNAVSVVSDLAFVEAPLVVEDMTRADAFSCKDNLTCLVAGEQADIARALPLLEAMVGAVRMVGGFGSAQLARAAHTLQTAAQMLAAVEADALHRAVCRMSAGSDCGHVRVEAVSPQAERVLEAVSDGRFDGPFTVEMFMAELSAALMAADDADLILPQAEAAMHLLELLAVIGGADKAPAALALVYGEESECARNGLDWTRAEQSYGEDEYGSYDDCGPGEGAYRGGFDYSAN